MFEAYAGMRYLTILSSIGRLGPVYGKWRFGDNDHVRGFNQIINFAMTGLDS